MRALAALAFVLTLAPAAAHACIAREPIRRVVRASLPEMRECMARHEYERGTYVMQFEIDGTGKVMRVAMVSGPTEPSLPAQSCMAAVFTRMRFVSYTPAPAREVDVRSGAGRTSAVPPDMRHRRRRGRIIVNYPLALSP